MSRRCRCPICRWIRGTRLLVFLVLLAATVTAICFFNEMFEFWANLLMTKTEIP